MTPQATLSRTTSECVCCRLLLYVWTWHGNDHTCSRLLRLLLLLYGREERRKAWAVIVLPGTAVVRQYVCQYGLSSDLLRDDCAEFRSLPYFSLLPIYVFQANGRKAPPTSMEV